MQFLQKMYSTHVLKPNRYLLIRSFSTGVVNNQKVSSKSIRGIFPPVSTPFDKNGNICYGSLEKNLNHLYKTPLNGYLAQGSNGEYPFLDPEERVNLVKSMRTYLPNKVLMAGSGCESTQATIDMSNKMADNGADCLLVINPFYFKTQMNENVIYNHFEKIADASYQPIILYNMPGNTGINIPLKVVELMAQHPNCIGIKDSGGDITRMATISQLTASYDFTVLVGSAALILPGMILGCHGCIGALANVLPTECCDLYKLCLDEKWQQAIELQKKLVLPNTTITSKYGPAGLKAAHDLFGLYGANPRLPLQPLSSNEINHVKDVFLKQGWL